MNKKKLESILGAELTANGFNKKGDSWYRQEPEALRIANLQKSSYGMQFYVNMCCVPAGMSVEGMPTPKEHKCPIRIRLAAAFPERRSDIEEAFDLETTSLDDSEREDLIIRLTKDLIFPVLDLMKNAASLKLAIEQGVFDRGSVNLAAKRHLGIMEKP